LAELLDPASLAWVCVIVLVAGLAHGLSGFGFPLISTPMVAVIADVRTAVLVTLVPNIVINVLSATRGGGWRDNLRRHGMVPLYVLAGTVVGTQVVLWAPADPLRLLLAAVIVLYLQQDRFTSLDWTAIARNPRASGLVAGLLGGFLSGTVNVMLPPLLIYFSSLGLAPTVMTQVMNACFLAGKLTQAAVFALHGQLGIASLALTLPICATALCGYALGMRLQPRVTPAAYLRLIRAVLWAMAALLLLQGTGLV
jgi:uncharacterized membrane protein YfcA